MPGKARINLIYMFIGVVLLGILLVVIYIYVTQGRKLTLSNINTDYVLPDAAKENAESAEKTAPRANDRDLMHNEDLMHEIEAVHQDTVDMGAVQPIDLHQGLAPMYGAWMNN